ncbi:MAG: glycoside hydrolase family 88 protein [Clostridia bacterium]|nr:glycoside hydrolase family 88 protein [Clostridia bacterium]
MTLNDAYKICCEKTKLHMKKNAGLLIAPTESFTADYYDDAKKCDFAGNRWVWLNSMITGMVSIYAQTENDLDAIKSNNEFKKDYHDKVFVLYTQTMHDIGFLYIPYSVHMYQLTGDVSHRDTALKAADELAKRFNPRGRFIEAWDDMNMEKRECRMIVDSSMNVPLLFWAWQETGHYFYRDIADCHLETIIKTLVRDDYSVAHAWFFDSATGEPTLEANSCGFANGSFWARGTAWLVFGLAMAYSYTKNEYYLEVATKVGEKYLDSLAESPVPVWDFRLPEDKPAKICSNMRGDVLTWDESDPKNMIYNVDTSAAAIMACGFELINSFKQNERFEKYVDDALAVLSNEYLNTDTTKTALLRASNGRNGYTIYGDYYYMLALSVKLYNIKSPWGSIK